jgi:MOSC domain-containing protein YiiM
VQQNDGNLGVYASVEKPGNIKLGDNIEWLPSDSSATAG